MTDEAIIEVDQVSRWFGDVVAVSEVSFTVGTGVTALLGPNGAGKSTVLRMLCGLVAPARGTVRVLGKDPRTDVAVHRQIGLVPQQETLFDTQSAYSRGMRQRVKVAQAIVHDPKVIVLDEPLTGLDPRQRRHMTELFHRLGDEGRCVIISSHVLDEVERFGSNVLVIAQGRLAAEGDFRAIRDLMDDRPHRLRVRTDKPNEVAGDLLAAGAVVAIRLEGADRLLIDTVDVHRFRRLVAVVAARQDAHLWEVSPLDDDLDSVFRYLVGR